MPVRLEIQVVGDREVQRDLEQLYTRVRRQVMRRGVQAGTRIQTAAVKQELRKNQVTGATARSIRSRIQTARGPVDGVMGRVGQLRSVQINLTNKKVDTYLQQIGGKNLSQIERQGKAAPLHWIERGVGLSKQRVVRPKKAKALRFAQGGQIVNRMVTRPGPVPGKFILENVGKRTSDQVIRVYFSTVDSEIQRLRERRI